MFEMMLGELAIVNEPPVAPGQSDYVTAGSFIWTCPADVYKVCVAVLGGGTSGFLSGPGYGGDGGALRYRNNVPVVPGGKYTITVGSGGVTRMDIYGGSYPATGGGLSTAFGLEAGARSRGTAIGGNVFGFNGGAGIRSDNPRPWGRGGNPASYTANGANNTTNTNSQGISLKTGQLMGSTVGAGFGGIMYTPYLSADPKQSYAGGAGAVRIIWGTGRSFPSNNIGDM